MGSLRSLMSFWNEILLPIGLLLLIGYFGVRGTFAYLPLLLLTAFVVGGIGYCVWMAIQSSQPADDYSEGTQWGDRALWFTVMFLFSTLAVTVLGTLL